MSLSHWLAFAVSAVLPLLATAQTQDPTDANAAVPAPAYVSAFRGYRTAADEQESPDNAWRSANDTVARLNGHVGHMQGAATVPAGREAQAESATKDGSPAHGHHRLHPQSKGRMQ